MTTNWTEVVKNRAAGVLPSLNAAKLLADLKAHGCTVECQDGQLKVRGKPLTQVLRDRIKKHKDVVLAFLNPEKEAAQWDEGKYHLMVQKYIELMDRYGWSDEPCLRLEQRAVADAVDAAWDRQDGETVRRLGEEVRRLFAPPEPDPTADAPCPFGPDGVMPNV